MKALHQVEQGNSVPLTQLAFSLPETGNNFTIYSHSVRLVDSVSFLRRFQQVPQLVSQKRAVPVLGKAAVKDLLLISSTLTV
jgi:hypothetical protein